MKSVHIYDLRGFVSGGVCREGEYIGPEFYRKKLDRRLLFDKSANDDHERSILTKLKQQCGGQFTSKMEGMVRIRFPMKVRTCSKHMSSNVNKCYMHSSVMQSLYLQFMMNICIVRESRKINVTNKKNVQFAG